MSRLQSTKFAMDPFDGKSHTGSFLAISHVFEFKIHDFENVRQGHDVQRLQPFDG